MLRKEYIFFGENIVRKFLEKPHIMQLHDNFVRVACNMQSHDKVYVCVLFGDAKPPLRSGCHVADVTGASTMT